MMPPEAVTLTRDGSARGSGVWAPLDTGDFETLALAVAFLVATAPPSASRGPEERMAAGLAALPESDRRVFELDRQREDGTRTTARGNRRRDGLVGARGRGRIRRISQALWRANPPPPTDTGSTGLHVVRSSGEDISVASTWGEPSTVVSLALTLVEAISEGLEWRPASPDGDDGEICRRRARWRRSGSSRRQDSSRSRSRARRRATGTGRAPRPQDWQRLLGVLGDPRCDFTTDDQPTGAS